MCCQLVSPSLVSIIHRRGLLVLGSPRCRLLRDLNFRNSGQCTILERVFELRDRKCFVYTAQALELHLDLGSESHVLLTEAYDRRTAGLGLYVRRGVGGRRHDLAKFWRRAAARW